MIGLCQGRRRKVFMGGHSWCNGKQLGESLLEAMKSFKCLDNGGRGEG